MSKTKAVWLIGFSGKMGAQVIDAIEKTTEFKLIGGTDAQGNFVGTRTEMKPAKLGLRDSQLNVDVVIDFSVPGANRSLLQDLKSRQGSKPSVLIATTGLESSLIKEWEQYARESNSLVLVAPNTSVGVLATLQAANFLGKHLRKLGFDIEISETHHKRKQDAPSGTAKMIADSLAKNLDLKPVYDRKGARKPDEIGVFGLRGGGVYGEHTISFLGEEETIELTHRALSRSLFAEGSIVLAKWLSDNAGRESGLQYVWDIAF
ncbi:MAG: 4-hydroxy-tetrahydrodipicolinate reductase [Oligoflexales bacterium]